MRRTMLFVYWVFLGTLKWFSVAGILLGVGCLLAFYLWMLVPIVVAVVLAYVVDWCDVLKRFEEWERRRAIRARKEGT